MDKLMKKSHQSLKLLPIAALLIITPLLSTSLRFKYLYFIVNILIIAVGAEAGLLSFFLQSDENKKPSASSVVAQKPVIYSEVSPVKEEKVSPDKENTAALSDNGANGYDNPKPVKAVENCSSEKISVGVEVLKVKKSPSNPSIFFVGGGESTHHAEELIEDNEVEEAGDISGQELYQKAETFIGNFYKQLKMQREESWKKLHDLSQKAF